MNFGFKIVEIKVGKRASIYTLQREGEEQTELDKFLVKEEVKKQKEALEFIIYRLYETIPKKGAQDRFFEHDGKADDAVCKLRQSILRCYCLRYGTLLIIVGSGGTKPKGIQRTQDKKDLQEAVKTLQYIEKRIEEAREKSQFAFSYTNGKITNDSKIHFETK